MLSFLKNKKTDIFFILLFALLFILATQLMPFAAISFSDATGITIKADILLAGIITMGLLRGKKSASYYALITGFLFDVYIGNPYCFSPLVFFLCGYFAGFAARPFSHRTPLSVAFISGMLVWIKSVFSLFYLMATSGDSGAGAILVFGILPEYIANIIACVIIFTIIRILMALFRIHVKEDIR
jgi:rod shape-determining protein MreD